MLQGVYTVYSTKDRRGGYTLVDKLSKVSTAYTVGSCNCMQNVPTYDGKGGWIRQRCRDTLLKQSVELRVSSEL